MKAHCESRSVLVAELSSASQTIEHTPTHDQLALLKAIQFHLELFLFALLTVYRHIPALENE